MSTLTLAALVSVAGLGHVWQDYETAYETALRENRGLLVLITADWCGPCQRLKRQVLPSPQLQSTLDSYVCALVNVDRQPELAKALGGKAGVPLLIAYHRTGRGWSRREIRGYQSVAKLKQFLIAAQPPTIRRTAGAESGEGVSQLDSPGLFGSNPTEREPSAQKPSHAKVQLLGILPEEPAPMLARKQTPRRTDRVGSTRR